MPRWRIAFDAPHEGPPSFRQDWPNRACKLTLEFSLEGSQRSDYRQVKRHAVSCVLDEQATNIPSCPIKTGRRIVKREWWDRLFGTGVEHETAPNGHAVFRADANPLDNVKGNR
jgi:hypothetical protein